MGWRVLVDCLYWDSEARVSVYTGILTFYLRACNQSGLFCSAELKRDDRLRSHMQDVRPVNSRSWCYTAVFTQARRILETAGATITLHFMPNRQGKATAPGWRDELPQNRLSVAPLVGNHQINREIGSTPTNSNFLQLLHKQRGCEECFIL